MGTPRRQHQPPGWGAWHGDGMGGVTLGTERREGGDIGSWVAAACAGTRPRGRVTNAALAINLFAPPVRIQPGARGMAGAAGPQPHASGGSAPLLWSPKATCPPPPKPPLPFAGPAAPQEPSEGLLRELGTPRPPLGDIKGSKHPGGSRAQLPLPLAPPGGGEDARRGWGRGWHGPAALRISTQCHSTGCNSTFTAGY